MVARRRRRRIRSRWIPRRLSLAATRRNAVAAVLVVTSTLVLGCASAGWLSSGVAPPIEQPVARRTLPVLPIIPTQFDGVPLERYLSQAAVTYDPIDDLLTSPVLRDPEFASAVHWWVEYWTVYATDWFPGFLTRMATRGSTVDSALAIRGFPPSLRYLPLIESGYDPTVTSRSGAVGLWQLMPTTARGLGLEVAPPVDERRHAEKSTEAALSYLDELYAEFGSWFLVLAAYNSGPTRVRGILRRHAPQEPLSDSLFWALRRRFPAETRDFVPKLYGAMWVASQPEAYGYEGSAYLNKVSAVDNDRAN